MTRFETLTTPDLQLTIRCARDVFATLLTGPDAGHVARVWGDNADTATEIWWSARHGNWGDAWAMLGTLDAKFAARAA